MRIADPCHASMLLSRSTRDAPMAHRPEAAVNKNRDDNDMTSRRRCRRDIICCVAAAADIENGEMAVAF